MARPDPARPGRHGAEHPRPSGAEIEEGKAISDQGELVRVSLMKVMIEAGSPIEPQTKKTIGRIPEAGGGERFFNNFLFLLLVHEPTKSHDTRLANGVVYSS